MWITTHKVRLIRQLQAKGYKIGTTNGCFDLMHPSHVHFLRKCKQALGPRSFLVVLVNSDDYIRRYKGANRPVIPQHDRRRVVQAIKGVGLALLFTEKDPAKWIRRIGPDMHFKGSDWKDKDCPEAKYAPITFIDSDTRYFTTSVIDTVLSNFGRIPEYDGQELPS